MRSTTNLSKWYLINIIYKYCIQIKKKKKNQRDGRQEVRLSSALTTRELFWLSTFPLACNGRTSASHSLSQEILSDQSARGLTRQTSAAAAAAAPKVKKKKRFHYISFIFIV